MRDRLTVRGAARAAKQLHYHRHRLNWIANRIHDNEDLLISYLEQEDADAATLPGGYRVTVERDGLSRKVSIAKHASETRNQLVLPIERREIA